MIIVWGHSVVAEKRETEPRYSRVSCYAPTPSSWPLLSLVRDKFLRIKWARIPERLLPFLYLNLSY